MAHANHEKVRKRWGYCEVSEEDTGGDLTVDHFVPVIAGGDDSDGNLVYACFSCNLFKGDFYPTAEDRIQGRRILHPLQDDLSKHLQLDVTNGKLAPLSETGRFHIAMLHLNRQGQVSFRMRRRFYELQLERSRLIEIENVELRRIIVAQEEYVAQLRRLANRSNDVSGSS